MPLLEIQTRKTCPKTTLNIDIFDKEYCALNFGESIIFINQFQFQFMAFKRLVFLPLFDFKVDMCESNDSHKLLL
jgi:hypothetical protein